MAHYWHQGEAFGIYKYTVSSQIVAQMLHPYKPLQIFTMFVGEV